MKTCAFFSLISTLEMIAGDIALVTKISGVVEYSMTSIISPQSSPLTAFILVPFTPTTAPIGSIDELSATSATFARWPGILAHSFTITLPSFISGTSDAKSASKNLGEVRESSIVIPCWFIFTRRMMARTVSPTLNLSLKSGLADFIRFLSGMKPFKSSTSK